MLDKKEHQLYLIIHTKYENSILPQIPHIIYTYLTQNNKPIPQISLEELLQKLTLTTQGLNQSIINILEEHYESYRTQQSSTSSRPNYKS